MPRKNRNLNVFSVSAIDVFASAMGAFMLISFIILPFYPNISPEPPRETPGFLSFVIFWDAEGTDIDLYIVEEIPGKPPRTYNYADHNRGGVDFPDSQAELSVDVRKGPGVEIWETPEFQDGAVYTFAYHFYAPGTLHEGPVEVEGRLYHGEGYHVIRPRTLTYRSNVPASAVIRVEINEERRVVARAVDNGGGGSVNMPEL